MATPPPPTPRQVAQNDLLEAVFGPEDQGSLGMSIVGMLEAEQAIVHRIGMLYVDSKDSEANDLRDCLYWAQTVREVAERFLAEARRIQENAS